MSKVKVIRQPTAEATLIFEFETASSEFLVKNFTDGDIYASLERDATKEQSVLIPAQTAQRLQIRFLRRWKEQPRPKSSPQQPAKKE